MPMNAPNMLTMARILLIPVLLLSLSRDQLLINMLSASIFGLAAFTDFLDGYLARKMELVTDFGKIMDPVADKLLVAAALVSLVERGDLAAWLVVAVLGREFAVTALRAVAGGRGYIMPADNWGKWKTGLQITAIILLILKWQIWKLSFAWLGMAFLVLALLLAYGSMINYFLDYRRFLRREREAALRDGVSDHGQSGR